MPTSYSEALEIVHDLATQNRVDDVGDDLAAEAGRQSTALSTVADFLANHAEAMDELAMPEGPAEWPHEAWRADPGDDQAQVLPALKTVLDMGAQNTLDPDDHRTQADDLVDEARRQDRAVAMVRDLVARHADELAKVVVIDVSPIMRG